MFVNHFLCSASLSLGQSPQSSRRGTEDEWRRTRKWWYAARDRSGEEGGEKSVIIRILPNLIILDCGPRLHCGFAGNRGIPVIASRSQPMRWNRIAAKNIEYNVRGQCVYALLTNPNDFWGITQVRLSAVARSWATYSLVGSLDASALHPTSSK